MGLSIADMLFTYRADISDLSSKMGTAKLDMQRVSEQAQTTGGGILSGFKTGMSGVMDFGAKVGLAITGFNGIAQSAISVGQALLMPNASMEQTTVGFETLLGAGKNTQNFLDSLKTFAANTPFEFPELATDAQHMLAFGFTTKEVLPTLTSIGDAMSAMGKSNAEISSIVTVFGQMKAAGKVNAQDMMQLTSQGIPAWKMLAEAMGLTVPQVQALSQKGILPADQAIKDLTAGMEKMFGGGMAKQATTFMGLFSTLQDNANAALRAFTGPLFDAAKQGLLVLGNLVSSKAFQDFASGSAQQIAKVLGTIGSIISSNVGPAFKLFMTNFVNDEPIGIFIGIFQNLGSILKSLYSIFQSLSPTFALFVAMFKNFDAKAALITAVNDFISAVYIINAITGDAANLIQSFATWLDKGGLPAQIFKDALIGVGVALAVIKAVAIATAIADFISILPIVIGLTWMWVAGLTAAAIEMVIATWPIILIGIAIAAVVAIIILAVQHWGDIVKWLQSAWAATVSFFAGIWAGIVAIFQGIGKWFTDRWNETTKGAQSAWGGVVSFFAGIWAKITGFFGGIGQWFHDKFSGAADGAQSGFSKVQGFFGGIGDWFHSRGTDASKGLQSGWNDAVGAAKVMAHGVIDAGKWLYDHDIYVHEAVDKTNDALKAGNKWILSAWDTSVHAVQAAWTWLANGAVSIWNTVTTAIKVATLAVVAWVVNAWNVSAKAVSDAWTWVANGAVWLWNLVTTAIHNAVMVAVNFLIGIWNTVTTFLVGVWTTVTTWLAARWAWVSAQAQAIWNAIVFVIEAALYLAWKFIVSVWTTASTWLQARWTWISTVATALWAGIYATISVQITKVTTWLSTQWTIAVTWLQAQWALIAGFAGVAWAAVSAVFGGIWTKYISGPLASLWTSITGWWANLTKSASNLGGNFMKQLAAGIAAGTGIIGQALHDAIAGAMWNLGLRNIPGWVGGTVPTTPGHASGIIDNPFGHVGWVGERGPELMYIPKAASIFPTGSSASYPIKPSPIAVQSASANGGSSPGNSTSGQTLVFQIDTQELARMTNTATNKIVNLKLGPKGRTA